MCIKNIRFTYFVAFAALTLFGCSSTPPIRSGQGLLPNPFASKPIAETIKEEQKSIAVTNIFYKKEGANVKYVEEISNKYDSNASISGISGSADKSAPESKSSDTKDIFSDIQTSAFPIKFTNVSDFKPSDHPTIQKDLEARLAADGIPVPPSNSSTPSAPVGNITTNSQVVKKAGIERQAEYGQLRSFSAAIRGLLIKSGYKVVMANTAVPVANQGDDFFQVVERIKAGEFNGADYVMFGVLGEMSFTDNVDEIPGTKSTSQQIGLDLIVDFSLIDTKTYQVVASFLAEGNGKEVRIDGRDNGFKPSMAKLMKQASTTLAQDVARHLADQNFVTSTIAEPEIGRNYKRNPYSDDASTLKIYPK
jgi:hypothetical protein